MQQQMYQCPKCGNTAYVSDQFQATGGNFAKIFDVQNKKFITISCTGAASPSSIAARPRTDGIFWTFSLEAEQKETAQPSLFVLSFPQEERREKTN